MLGMERARCGACAECTRVVRCLTTETGTGSEMSENCVEIAISLTYDTVKRITDVFSLSEDQKPHAMKSHMIA